MRKVKVASISMFNDYREPAEGSPSVKRNMDICCERLSAAGQAGADIVCTPECCTFTGTDVKPDDTAEEIPGRISKSYTEIAARYQMYVFGWQYEKREGSIHNSLILFDRKGKIAGIYRKVHLTTGEVAKGVAHGNSFPVFETDFGLVSAVICFDSFFPESFKIPALGGAEIIFYSLVGSWSDYTPGRDGSDNQKSEELWTLRTRAYAYMNSVHIVTSGCCWQSNVIDPSGTILSTNHNEEPLRWNAEKPALAEIDLDKNEFFCSGNELGNVPRKKYLSSERRVSCYGKLVDPNIPLMDGKRVAEWKARTPE